MRLQEVSEYFTILDDEFITLQTLLHDSANVPMNQYIWPVAHLLQRYFSEELTKKKLAELSVSHPRHEQILSVMKQKTDLMAYSVGVINRYTSAISWTLNATLFDFFVGNGTNGFYDSHLKSSDLLQLRYTQAIDNYMQLGSRKFSLSFIFVFSCVAPEHRERMHPLPRQQTQVVSNSYVMSVFYSFTQAVHPLALKTCWSQTI